MSIAPPFPPASPPLPARGITRAARLVALLGGLLIIALSLLVTASVSLRYATSNGINGDFELVQMGLAVAVFSFLPLAQASRANIMVDTFTSRLPPRFRNLIDGFWDLVYAGFAAFIAWRLAIGASEALASRTTSMVLGLPIGYAIAICAALAGLLALTSVVCAISLARGRV